MKPLDPLVMQEVYSPFAIRYIAAAKGDNLEELGQHVHSNPPKALTVWGQKWIREADLDPVTGEETYNKRIARRGLGTKEEYESMQTRTEAATKKKKKMIDCFVAEGGNDPDDGDEPPTHATLWRFDSHEFTWGRSSRSQRPLPQALNTLACLTWNPGAYRQRLEPGQLIMKSMHFGMMQELSPETVMSLERAGATVHCGPHGLNTLPTCTFGRSAFISQSELLDAGCELKARFDGPPKE